MNIIINISLKKLKLILIRIMLSKTFNLLPDVDFQFIILKMKKHQKKTNNNGRNRTIFYKYKWKSRFIKRKTKKIYSWEQLGKNPEKNIPIKGLFKDGRDKFYS